MPCSRRKSSTLGATHSDLPEVGCAQYWRLVAGSRQLRHELAELVLPEALALGIVLLEQVHAAHQRLLVRAAARLLLVGRPPLRELLELDPARVVGVDLLEHLLCSMP